MPDTKQLLERAARSAPRPGYDLDAIHGRRARRRRSERLGASAVALLLTALAGVAAFAIARAPAGSDTASGTTGQVDALPPATAAALVAGEGEYHYAAVLDVAACGDRCTTNDVALDATRWWSPSDDSGRIVVDTAVAYGIDAGRFGPGAFPNGNGVDVSDFPLDPDELLPFLLERSDPNGGSPAPVVTPPPDGAPFDGQLWRAITDLLSDPHTTPAVRASLLEVAARLQGSAVTVDTEDPFGRPAHVIAFGNEGGSILERLYVDPGSHDLLTWTFTEAGEAAPARYYVVQEAGVAPSTETGPGDGRSSIPPTSLSVDDLRALGEAAPGRPEGDPGTDRCSQGSNDLVLTRSEDGYDHDCFVVEAGGPFTITFTIEPTDVRGAIRILDAATGDVIFEGDPIIGPGRVRYDIPRLGFRPGEANDYLVLDGETLVGTLYAR